MTPFLLAAVTLVAGLSIATAIGQTASGSTRPPGDAPVTVAKRREPFRVESGRVALTLCVGYATLIRDGLSVLCAKQCDSSVIELVAE